MRALLCALLSALLQQNDALHVCVVLEAGFDMLADGVADPTAVSSNAQLEGFNADVRTGVLNGVLGYDFTVTAYTSWAELNVRTRSGECDVGWAAFYLAGARDRCMINNDGCKDLSTLDWTSPDLQLSSYRCCIDFSANYYTWVISIMAPGQGKKGFFEALFASLSNSFVCNFICFAFIFMVVGGHLIWIVERKANSDNFPSSYLDGIDDSIWWAMVTATTVVSCKLLHAN